MLSSHAEHDDNNNDKTKATDDDDKQNTQQTDDDNSTATTTTKAGDDGVLVLPASDMSAAVTSAQGGTAAPTPAAAAAAAGYGGVAYHTGDEYEQAVAVNVPAPAVPYVDVAMGDAQAQAQQQQMNAADGGGGRGGYKGAHPIAAIFHVIFKAAALLTFLLGGIFSSSYVLIFIITILLVVADFWTTKNITGRLMVCLRWWNEVRDDGSTRWVFESSPAADDKVNRYDRWLFWVVLVGYSAAWLFFCIINLMSVTRLPIAVIGLALALTNLMGYVKCQRDARARVTQFMLSRASAVNFGFGRS